MKDWKSILDVAQPNISFNTADNDTHLISGKVANIKKSRCNTTPIPRPSAFLYVVHCDIGHSDCKAVGGTRFCLLLVDRATRSCWTYAFKSFCHDNIKRAFQQFQVDSGSLPYRLYTEFYNKRIAGSTEQFLVENGCKVCASPNNHHDKNGFVECAWQAAVSMA